MSSERGELAGALAGAMLEGSWDDAALLRNVTLALGELPGWAVGVIVAVLDAYRERPADRIRELTAFVDLRLEAVEELARADFDGEDDDFDPEMVWSETSVRLHFHPEPAMGRTRWPVPAIPTRVELAAFLDLHPGELDWLADVRGINRREASRRLRHYTVVWLPRAGRPPRPIERPKRLLKDVQRRVLHQILDRVPPHEAAHGFRRGHSALTNARRHVRREVVIGLDLEDFFASVTASRVYGIFRAVGYPEEVAHLLTGLCTTSTAAADLARLAPGPHAARLRRRLFESHLPQGAPTSPALANLSAYRLDLRLSALADSVEAVYSRYADDVTFSGDHRLHAIRRVAETIARDEGFRPSESKARLTTRAGRQRVTGIVVNERPNATRREYDLLKATLHDAERYGPAQANRTGRPEFRAHLLGRIAWVESLNPPRGARLRRRFEEIDWSEKGGNA